MPPGGAAIAAAAQPAIEPLLLAATRVSTFLQQRLLTQASGFFFQRDERLYLVTSRHVCFDEPSGHHPDRLEIELHTDAGNMTDSIGFSIPLYRDGQGVWIDGLDGSGEIDVAVVELERAALPATAIIRAFTPQHLEAVQAAAVEVGTSLLIVGFPLGFHDTLHHLPVVRQAVIASSYGMRFKGEGYFLTDARTHRGTSGAPVVARLPAPLPDPAGGELQQLPWLLLGVHSARLDVDGRDLGLDEALGLNCAWYADILMVLTRGGPRPPAPAVAPPVPPPAAPARRS
ncbi:serine protease [uncultured Methylibium sp.]|uniref:S1 family peptidase n=1 Tax=uncultured Methylibium sp. TaxID=381093 RepID=UPI0025EDD5A2|nr:serine protease [uncultured Methylibium sp.]